MGQSEYQTLLKIRYRYKPLISKTIDKEQIKAGGTLPDDPTSINTTI